MNNWENVCSSPFKAPDLNFFEVSRLHDRHVWKGKSRQNTYVLIFDLYTVIHTIYSHISIVSNIITFKIRWQNIVIKLTIEKRSCLCFVFFLTTIWRERHKRRQEELLQNFLVIKTMNQTELTKHPTSLFCHISVIYWKQAHTKHAMQVDIEHKVCF